MVRIKWWKVFEAVWLYLSYVVRKKVDQSNKWAVILPLYGLWEYGREPEEMIGYNEFMDSVAQQIAFLSSNFGQHPKLIFLCGGKTRTDIPEFANLSEAQTCRKPFVTYLQKYDVNLGDDTIILVENTQSTPDNIQEPVKLLQTTYGYQHSDIHLVVFSDKCRSAKTTILCAKYISEDFSFQVESAPRLDIHPNSKWWKQLIVVLNQL